MNAETLNAATAAAERFVKLAEQAEGSFVSIGCVYNPKDTGAARRASMDLTRALADMRRPG